MTLTMASHPERGWAVDPETGLVFGVAGRWRGKRLGRVGSHGYMVTTLRGRAYLLHRVVWEACVGPIPERRVVNHKNGVKTDNRLCNLEVVTSGENNAHAYATGLKVHRVCGPKNGNYRVTPAIRADILARLARGEAGSAIARELGLSGATVSRVKRGVR
jgi:hypothetical protein